VRKLTMPVSELSAVETEDPSMKKSSALFFVLIASALSLLPPGAVRADDIGHDQARRLVQEGKIKPLQEIVEMLLKQAEGRVLEAELEHEDEGFVYELKILRPGGYIEEVEVLASTGQILKIEIDD
jgi:uncharacterized membrane protein YkoI